MLSRNEHKCVGTFLKNKWYTQLTPELYINSSFMPVPAQAQVLRRPLR